MRARFALVVVALIGCRTVEGPTGQGGAGFHATTSAAPAVPMESMFGVCWPATSLPSHRLVLTPQGGDVVFEAKDGASNGTGWCLREIVTSYPPAARPTTALELAPPSSPVDLWAALAWVSMLSPGRFGPERGLLDPAPWAAACLSTGATRGGTIAVEHAPLLTVRGLTSIESERCLSAVLGATAWPAPKDLRLALSRVPKTQRVEPGLEHYFAPAGDSTGTLDPQIVKETMRERSSQISVCWNEALRRRAGLFGARTFRFRTDASGALTAAWVSSLDDGKEASDALLDRCIVNALKGVRFPGTAGDGLYTWVFASR